MNSDSAYRASLRAILNLIESVEWSDQERADCIATIARDAIEGNDLMIPNEHVDRPRSYVNAVTGVEYRERLTFGYLNWRGDFGYRTVVGAHFWKGCTAWHPEEQWFVKAFDVDKQEWRDFSCADIVFHASHATRFRVGQKVVKDSGDARWLGHVASVYRTMTGKLRYVIDIIPQGFQMIASESQLRPWDFDDDQAVENLGFWLSAALEDENVAPEYKQAIRSWFGIWGEDR